MGEGTNAEAFKRMKEKYLRDAIEKTAVEMHPETKSEPGVTPFSGISRESTPTGIMRESYKSVPNIITDGERRMSNMEAVLKNMATMMQAQDVLRQVAQTQQMPPPPPFDGTNARGWILSMEQYFQSMNLEEDKKLSRILTFLTGKALNYYCSFGKNNPGEQPTTWEEFKNFILRTYSSEPTLSITAQLEAVEFKGSIQDVAIQFTNILAQGNAPPDEWLKRAFIRVFPWKMVRYLKLRKFKTWREVKEHMEREYAETRDLAQDYFLGTSDLNKKFMLRDAEVVAAGWLNSPTADREKQRLLGSTNVKGNSGKRGSSSPRLDGGSSNLGNSGNASEQHGGRNFSAANAANVNGNNQLQQRLTGGPVHQRTCYTCHGVGHIAKVCPNHNPETKKDGNRCNKCGGMGHWAPSCPTPRIERVEQPRVHFATNNEAQSGNVEA